VKFAGQHQDSFLELLLSLLGAEIPLQVRKAGGLGLSPDKGRVELVRAGLLLVGEMQEMGDVVAVVHGFIAGEAAVLAACPGDDGVFLSSPSEFNELILRQAGLSILLEG
jgi:hypothetical protein